MSPAPFLLYGATGYTGALIAAQCAARRIDVVLAGRSEAPLRALAERLRVPYEVCALDDDAALDRALARVSSVLHCAGPFSQTSRPMVDACIRNARHYLDITGEAAVFEALAARGDEAKAAGVTLLPGVGFDVVPSDCLAAHMKRRIPDAVSLSLCIAALGGMSHGTASTVIEMLADGGLARVDGRLVRERVGGRSEAFDLGDGRARTSTSLPLADVVTAWHSTGIPNIAVFMPAPASMRGAFTMLPILAPFLRTGFIRRAMQARVKRGGPSDDTRARRGSVIVAHATAPSGARSTSRLHCSNGYAYTVDAAIACVARIADAPRGFTTPSLAFGADFALTIPGTSRVDV